MAELQDRVLVAGAGGFIGSNAVRWFAEQGCRVTALARRRRGSDARNVAWRDFPRDPAALASLLAAEGVRAVVNCCGVVNGTPEQLAQGNEGVVRLLAAALEAHDPDLPLVHVSSVSAGQAGTDYGASKARGERVVKESRLTRWVILRPSLVYGPGDTKNVSVIVQAVRRFPVVPVPEKVVLQPLYVDDLFPAMAAALAGAGGWQGTYVLAGPRQESLLDMARMVCQALGRRRLLLPVPVWPVRMALGLLGALLPFLPRQQAASLAGQPFWDASAASRDLGFQPRTFAAGMARLAEAEGLAGAD